WYVDDDGGANYTSIQEAIDAAEDGDTIRVWEGTYEENVVVNKRVSLIGNGSADTTIDGGGSGNVVRIEADWVNISGFTVTGSGGGNVGIIIIESSNNTIFNNTCSYNRNGICLSYSKDNTLTDNRMWGDKIVIYGSDLEHWNTHTIDTTNTVNGKPVYYYKDFTGITVPSGAEQVIIANCTQMVVDNQNMSDGNIGIQLGFSSNIIISNNTCENNGLGILLYRSNSNTISNNICSNNGHYGIELFSSDNNTLSNNTCSNSSYGIYLSDSDDNTLTNNNCSNNNYYGIYLRSAKHNIITNNTCNSNNESGIYLRGAEHNIISNNTCNSNNDHGIWLSSSSNVLTNNNCSNNSYGIYLSGSEGNTLTDNTCSNNSYGIRLYRSDSNTFTNNTISGNINGIRLEISSLNNIAHYNNIFNNTKYGIDASNNHAYTINATNNWWGHESGPYHPTNNSQGKGNNVTDYVEFDPWIGKELIIYVDDNAPAGGDGSREHPFNKIQDAINAAIEGSTIYVWEGTYYENVVVRKPVSLIGNGSEDTVIDGMNESCPLKITEDGVKISNLCAQNSGKHCGGIYVSAKWTNITNCRIQHNRHGAVAFAGQSSYNNIINLTFSVV
ncbi:MAG: right-handed parallel beta-helix repeat-containing protein, partial [Thermoplasmata archaeon]|nr:right-handed parallel beta-helix repeat-containing protein [Thermoplasmata archaeon]